MNKEHLIERVLKPYPTNSYIVDKSTAVVSFGNSLSASFATVGINPSSAEFQEDKAPLTGELRRLEDFYSLGVDTSEQLNPELAERVVDGCFAYFNQGKNPYKDWFGKFEENVLSNLGLSYWNGSACHLDLVQWATDPVWGDIKEKEIRNALIKDDIEFLSDQLDSRNIKAIFLGSSLVKDQMEKADLIDVEVADVFNYKTTSGSTRSVSFYKGRTKFDQPVLGWSRTFSRQYISPENYALALEKLNHFVKDNS